MRFWKVGGKAINFMQTFHSPSILSPLPPPPPMGEGGFPGSLEFPFCTEKAFAVEDLFAKETHALHTFIETVTKSGTCWWV